jgi:hypothetical protein
VNTCSLSGGTPFSFIAENRWQSPLWHYILRDFYKFTKDSSRSTIFWRKSQVRTYPVNGLAGSARWIRRRRLIVALHGIALSPVSFWEMVAWIAGSRPKMAKKSIVSSLPLFLLGHSWLPINLSFETQFNFHFYFQNHFAGLIFQSIISKQGYDKFGTKRRVSWSTEKGL